MSEIISILIPTYNNPNFLIPCVESILTNKPAENFLKIYIIDNGDTRVLDYIPKELLRNQDIVIIEPGENLGWEGGLKIGLKYVPADTEFVMFLNDDTFIPQSSKFWLNKMLEFFRDEKVGAVGPTSNVVMGNQNVFIPTRSNELDSQLLIGFCMLVRKSALDKAGGVDDTLPGGDDFDLSIRMVDAGYKLLIDRSTFVYHHGFKTGERLKGDASIQGGWNSYEMLQKVNTALIQKHGFKRFQELMISISNQTPYLPNIAQAGVEDAEGIEIRKLVSKPPAKIYELGAGGQLTFPNSIGVDMIEEGGYISTIKAKSVATIRADISKELPFKDAHLIVARHILEHVVNPIETLKHWYNSMVSRGQIIIAVPNEELFRTIPVNIEHKHAYTPAFLVQLLFLLGFTDMQLIDPKNGVSFIISAIKP